MSELKCKYKFQDNEKFDGKPYCTLFNELCEDISFVCDKNCQVFEDYKQYQQLNVENGALELKYAPRKCKHFCCGDCSLDGKSCGHDINIDAVCIEKYEELRQSLQKIRDIIRYVSNGENKYLNRALQIIEELGL